MKQVIKLTLSADLGSCITMFFYLTITDSFGMGIYGGIFTFGNILFPTLGAVLIFLLLKRITTLNSFIFTIALQAIILAAIYFAGLCIWASIDAYLFKSLTLENIQADYQSQFSVFLPVVFSNAILIPLLDKWLVKRQETKNLRQE